MARIFSVDFEFEQQQFTALVSICNNDDGRPSFTVAPTDDHIRELLPEGKIMFCNPEEPSGNCPNPKMRMLVRSLASAAYRKFYPEGLKEC